MSRLSTTQINRIRQQAETWKRLRKDFSIHYADVGWDYELNVHGLGGELIITLTTEDIKLIQKLALEELEKISDVEHLKDPVECECGQVLPSSTPELPDNVIAICTKCWVKLRNLLDNEAGE